MRRKACTLLTAITLLGSSFGDPLAVEARSSRSGPVSTESTRVYADLLGKSGDLMEKRFGLPEDVSAPQKIYDLPTEPVILWYFYRQRGVAFALDAGDRVVALLYSPSFRGFLKPGLTLGMALTVVEQKLGPASFQETLANRGMRAIHPRWEYDLSFDATGQLVRVLQYPSIRRIANKGPDTRPSLSPTAVTGAGKKASVQPVVHVSQTPVPTAVKLSPSPGPNVSSSPVVLASPVPSVLPTLLVTATPVFMPSSKPSVQASAVVSQPPVPMASTVIPSLGPNVSSLPVVLATPVPSVLPTPLVTATPVLMPSAKPSARSIALVSQPPVPAASSLSPSPGPKVSSLPVVVTVPVPSVLRTPFVLVPAARPSVVSEPVLKSAVPSRFPVANTPTVRVPFGSATLSGLVSLFDPKSGAITYLDGVQFYLSERPIEDNLDRRVLRLSQADARLLRSRYRKRIRDMLREGVIIADCESDRAGRFILQTLPAGRYYLIAVADESNRFLVWQDRVTLQNGYHGKRYLNRNNLSLTVE